MKIPFNIMKVLGGLLGFSLLMSCQSDVVRPHNNPYIPDYSFSFDLNLQFPSYSSLLYPGNAVLINTVGAGVNGVIVFNAGGSYRAYEANCPNQYVSSCSRMQIKGGIRAFCPCDELEYSLFTGAPSGGDGGYMMIPYRTELVGNTLKVWN